MPVFPGLKQLHARRVQIGAPVRKDAQRAVVLLIERKGFPGGLRRHGAVEEPDRLVGLPPGRIGIAAVHGTQPVSYTHLDVYKRQEYIWTRRPNFSECNRPRFGIPVLFPNCGKPDNGVHIFNGQAYPMEIHGMADLCPWEVESVGPDGVTLILESSPLTKFLYPFDFTVLMNYNLQGNTCLLYTSHRSR